ncbi:DSBA oxidoreductase [Xylariaceae sp. FL0804]|nr:DSBA oxidoreductase [Xylariaceae sp. FL0804]
MTIFDIKVISDPVCPWCYIGSKRLEKAIDLYKKVYPGGKQDSFTISWLPFYLDPSPPAEGVPLRQRFLERYGPERALEREKRLKSIGQQEGIAFTFENKIGNTRDAHRLIQLGKSKANNAECRVVLELFRDYFEGDGDITSHATLAKVGVSAGLDRDEVEDWLKTGKGGDIVDAEVAQAVSKGINGVPNFTIQGQVLDGADDPQAFLDVFIKAKERKP